MGKSKNKSNEILKKKTQIKPKKLNPFEVHVNKEKFSILGRKLKHDKGMPGLSRSKAVAKRIKTLGQEYITKHKTNLFKDKRIGVGSRAEGAPNPFGLSQNFASKEEVLNARFLKEKLNQFKSKKRDIYNLNDEEILTHKGQTLEEIEQFHDTISDNDSDDEELGHLDAEFTSSAHFGGGIGGNSKNKDGENERKMAMDDMIAEQKRRKIKLTEEKQELTAQTEKLNKDWSELFPQMNKLYRTDEKKPKQDDFDRMVKEMIFERRGEVTDRLQSEDDLLKIEKEKLEKLETERLERMRGITEADKKISHRSADDLDDDFYTQSNDIETLAYNVYGDNINNLTLNSFNDNESDHMNANNKDEDDDEDDEVEDNNESESNNDDESDEEDNDIDNLDDLKSSDDSSLEEDKEEKVKAITKTDIKPKVVPIVTSIVTEAERKRIIEMATKELPYIFEIPETYEDFEALLAKHKNIEYQNIILYRMIKCNHPKIVPDKKPEITKLFTFLLQYCNDIFSIQQNLTDDDVISNSFKLFDKLSPYLQQLAQLNPTEATNCFSDVIKEKQMDFRNQKSKSYPDLDCLIFLKMTSNLYSTSDFQHAIVTPCFIFISQMLSKCIVRNRLDLCKGLFLITCTLEYTKMSKRFLPAAINFLIGSLSLCAKKLQNKILPPFIAPSRTTLSLVLHKRLTLDLPSYKLTSKDLHPTSSVNPIDNNFKIRILYTILRLLSDLLNLLHQNIGVKYLIEPFEKLLKSIETDYYPMVIKDKLDKCLDLLDKCMKHKLTYLTEQNKKPKVLKLLEPKFDKVYDDRKKRGNDKRQIQKSIEAGLKRKIKRETKGAAREIRLDNAFINNIKLRRQIRSDVERKQKVKRIYSEASIQQGELNALSRKRKHM